VLRKAKFWKLNAGESFNAGQHQLINRR